MNKDKDFKNIKMVVLDIDGTIMDKDFNISEAVKNTLTKAIDSNLNIVLATGRMFKATVPIAEKLGIKTPIITCQGSFIQDLNGNILLEHTVPDDLSRKIIHDLRNLGVQINVFINDELIAETETIILKEYARKRSLEYNMVDSFDNIEKINPTKILAIGHTPEQIDKIRDILKEKYKGKLNITKSTPYFCEIVDKNVSKGGAILFLAEKLGVKQSEVMAIGDQGNDKDMLEAAQIGVAMGNATEQLKQIADIVVKDVDNDGVVEAFNKLFI